MKHDSLIVALDVENFSKARRLVQKLGSEVSFYKVGLRLFIREGPEIVRWLKKKGFKVFLDLKLHDIPNTVAQAVESATRLGVDFITLHASGGAEMMAAGVQAAKRSARVNKKNRPKIFAVTVLTSLKNLSPIGISRSVSQQVLKLAKLAQQSGVDGIVCSPQEIRPLKKLFKSSLKILTPGIRLDSNSSDDQKRTATPTQAFADGADYIVVGRPILLAADPKKVVQKILQDS
jgi:orotidine-5'-phosphate decarboxylase